MKFPHVISYITVFAALVLMALVTFWVVYPYDVLTINNEPVPLFENTIRRGEFAILQFSYCKHSEAHGVVKTYIENELVKVPLPEQEDESPVGCYEVDILQPVPGSVEPGVYFYEYVIEYHVNPFRTHTETFISTEFEVK